ncbi:unnamed protein product [Parnassius apollo]|uniref:(apollo) hypothetical protein n=1 Tax=Parnassius apollo TaxID=110799 RepID=A0A8S3XZS0_PARAO|nr:unnamed protein product [Parnassius apollo]
MKLVSSCPTASYYTVTAAQRQPSDHHERGNRPSTQHQRVGSLRSTSCDLMGGQFSCSPDNPQRNKSPRNSCTKTGMQGNFSVHEPTMYNSDKSLKLLMDAFKYLTASDSDRICSLNNGIPQYGPARKELPITYGW